MKILLLSDIHGNFDALQAVLNDAADSEYREIWMLGDLGGYGPEAGQCYERLLSENVLMLPGNHDAYYAGKIGRDLFSSEALQALIISGQKLTNAYREMMKSLPEINSRKGFTLVHGSLSDPLLDYIINPGEALLNFSLLKTDVLLFGHTHRQGLFREEKAELPRWTRYEPGEKVSFKKQRVLINPGSVGQPRDGDSRAAWALLDTRAGEITFRRSRYDIQAYQEKMRKMGASSFLINRVEKGI